MIRQWLKAIINTIISIIVPPAFARATIWSTSASSGGAFPQPKLNQFPATHSKRTTPKPVGGGLGAGEYFVREEEVQPGVTEQVPDFEVASGKKRSRSKPEMLRRTRINFSFDVFFLLPKFKQKHGILIKAIHTKTCQRKAEQRWRHGVVDGWASSNAACHAGGPGLIPGPGQTYV
jgi:hypothetical protein